MLQGRYCSSSHTLTLTSLCGLLFQVVELVTGGAQVLVTNENKIFYLNLLAQYRLANQVREEVDHFLKGEVLCAPCLALTPCSGGTATYSLLVFQVSMSWFLKTS